MHSLSFLEPSRQLELRMVHMVTLGVVALKQCSFSSGPRLRVILNPLGLTEASVEGWLNEITLSNRNSSFAAVMSQPCSPWGADAEGGLEWPCSMRHLSCRSTQIHSASLKSCGPLLLQFPLLPWTWRWTSTLRHLASHWAGKGLRWHWSGAVTRDQLFLRTAECHHQGPVLYTFPQCDAVWCFWLFCLKSMGISLDFAISAEKGLEWGKGSL